MENGEAAAAIYEVDWKNQRITFFYTGVWKAMLQVHHAYSYEEVEQIFLQEIFLPGERETRRQLVFGEEGHLAYHVGERILSREFQGLIPGTGNYEWFSDFLVMGDAGKLLGNIRNIHKQKTRELENEYRASHDQLTGLYNRKTFEERFVELAKRQGGGCLGILDIDNFKRLNDECGHIQGDQALEAISRIMNETLPEGTLCGRFGGDEFLIFFPGVTEREKVKQETEKLTERLAALSLSGLPLTISVGFAFCPEWGMDFPSLLGHADAALRFSKKTGKNRYTFCTAVIERIIKADDQEATARKQRRMLGWVQEPGESRKRILAVVLISLAVLAGALFVGNSYGKTFRKVMMNESYTYLREISSQMSGDVISMIENNQIKMETVCAIMEKERFADARSLQEWLSQMAGIQGFTRIYLVDKSGTWHHGETQVHQTQMQEFTIDVLINRQMRMSTVRRINGADCMALGYPVSVQTADGKEYLGAVATLDGEAVRSQMRLSAFDGAGRAHIITVEGEAVLSAEGVEEPFFGDNLFAMLERAQLYDQESVDWIRDQIAAGENLQFHYNLGGLEMIATLMPVGIEDWYLMTVLSTSFLHEKSSAFSRLTMVSCLVIGVVFLVLVLIVLTIRERSRRRLMKAAYVDPVTDGNNLNRFLMQVPYNMAISGYRNVMLYANVVGFKTYNDRMGRTGADEILKKIYQEIDSTLGRGECMGRLMADHFGILLKAENLQQVTARIENWNLQIMRIGSREREPFSLALNYGIYVIDEPELDVQQMLDRANLARQSLSDDRRDKVSYALYDKTLKDRLMYEKELSDHMETALEHGEFRMFLQAKYGLATNTIVGAEALVRWIHPVRGMIMPGDFIPLFERNGFIERLDLYMFREACRWIHHLLELGADPIPVSVNLSISHFYNPNFLEGFRMVWEDYGFDPSLLELEFTESMMYGKMEEFQEIIEQIHSIGFRCSMDDFGSGYSSLNELGSLPLNVIKLDRRFFLDSSRNEQKQTTIRYAIRLIKALDMEVVAEGVECIEQVERLREYGCDIVQGYVFARPVDAGVLFEQLVAAKVPDSDNNR